VGGFSAIMHMVTNRPLSPWLGGGTLHIVPDENVVTLALLLDQMME
jgi:hypothetical protein